MLKKEIDLLSLDYTEYIANVNIHKNIKLSKANFLKRLESVKAIRVRDESINYNIKTLEDLKVLKYLHYLIRNGNFKGYIFEEYIQKYQRQIFIFGIPSKIYYWLKNTELDTIKKQLYNWQVASFFVFNDLSIFVEEEIHPLILKDILKIKEKYYDIHNLIPIEEFDNFNKHDDYKNIYNTISKQLTGALPPKFLEFPFLKYGISKKDWRVNIGVNCSFTIEIGYFNKFDWLSKIEKNQKNIEKYLGKSFTKIEFEDYLHLINNDSLESAESKSEFWEIWKDIYENYEISNSHFYNKLSVENEIGTIYLIQEEDKVSTKIGWTKGNVQKRLLALQTGNSQNLIIVGYFNTSNIKTEKILHQIYENKRVIDRNEWFNLTENDINNILNEEWRVENNIY